jgi:hypothetical protein
MRLIPPVVIFLSVFFVFLNPTSPYVPGELLTLYSLVLLPHMAGLVLLLRKNAAGRAAAAGFLCTLWAALGLYLIFLGIFLFSSAYPLRDLEIGWFAAFGLAVWMVVASLSYRAQKPGTFSKGALLGVLFAFVTPVVIAMLQRGHR